MQNLEISIGMVATNLKLNGITTVIINYINYLDLNKYKVTLIVGQGIAANVKKICNQKKINIIELAPRKEAPFRFYLQLYKVFLTHKFDIVHVHGSNASIGAELFLAKLAGIKGRIAHSHNTISTNMRINNLMKPIFKLSYTDGFACGKLAGKWLFNNSKFEIIPNGVRINNFKFDPKIRKNVREKLRLNNKFVIGHVGRFNYQKNHEFILKVFNEIYKINKSAVLILVGNGPDFEKFKKKAQKLACWSNIILYGESNKVAHLYMAMDSFLFPSHFEGLPVTLVEAQLSGLPCIVSDVITPEIKMSNNLKFVSLKDTVNTWTKTLLTNKVDLEERINFFNMYDSKISYYDIKKDVSILERQYDAIMERINNEK